MSGELTADGPIEQRVSVRLLRDGRLTQFKRWTLAPSSAAAGQAPIPTHRWSDASASCSGIPSVVGSNELSMNDNDTRFAAPFGGTGAQDGWSLVYIYDTAQGCRWLNLTNFTLGGQWGTTGTASYLDETASLDLQRALQPEYTMRG